jgi:hypothetical protein
MRTAAALLGAVCLLHDGSAARADPTVLAVIVHPMRTDRVSRQDLERIYLRKRRFWDDGSPIVPLNREPQSAARAAFSARVLHGDGAHLQAYWNQQYFQGIFPPTTLSSGAAVKRYVGTDRRAIGYIEANDVDPSVRVVLMLESDDHPSSPPP